MCFVSFSFVLYFIFFAFVLPTGVINVIVIDMTYFISDSGLDSCLDRRLDRCLDGGLDSCLHSALDSCLHVGLDSCLDGGLDSCLDSCLDGSLSSGLDGGLDICLDDGQNNCLDGVIDSSLPSLQQLHVCHTLVWPCTAGCCKCVRPSRHLSIFCARLNRSII